jgi:prepilin-type N-terminal cleavage/methylation domain-containing protein
MLMPKVSRFVFSRPKAAFTLVELMIVVVIMGILTTLAFPAFSNYLNKSRAQEAIDFLNVIKLRQESYRAEFGQYCTANTHPAAVSGSTPVAWNPPANSGWEQLGATPDGAVRFSFSTTAGFPGTTPDASWGLTGQDFWYWATAIGDLDGKDPKVTFGTSSGKKDIWCSSTRGWE